METEQTSMKWTKSLESTISLVQTEMDQILMETWKSRGIKKNRKIKINLGQVIMFTNQLVIL